MIPAGVTTATVHLDAPVSFTGDPGRIHAVVQSSVPLVWTATGTAMGNWVDTIDLNPGVDLDIELPHTDQPGFEDGYGNTFTDWYYTVTIVYEKNGQRIDFPAKDFQVLQGQETVDLALIPAGEAAPVPEIAPILPVTSIDGHTGALTLAILGLDRVDNTTDAEKPISDAAQDALDLKAPINNPSFTGTVQGVTKAMVGLGNVDNTSDKAKPLSDEALFSTELVETAERFAAGATATSVHVKSALDAAVTSKKVVRLRPGTYAGDLTIPSNTTLVGAGIGRTSIGGRILIGSNVLVQDLTVLAGTSYSSFSGNADGSTIERVEFKGGGASASFYVNDNKATNHKFLDCLFVDNPMGNGIQFVDKGTDAKHLENIEFHRCLFRNNGRMNFECIQRSDAGNPVVLGYRNISHYGCRFETPTNASGININVSYDSGALTADSTIRSSGYSTFQDNTIIGGGYALELAGPRNMKIVGNDISGSTSYLLSTSQIGTADAYSIFSNNRFTGTASENNVIFSGSQNIIEGNVVKTPGIFRFSSCGNSIVSHNYVDCLGLTCVSIENSFGLRFLSNTFLKGTNQTVLNIYPSSVNNAFINNYLHIANVGIDVRDGVYVVQKNNIHMRTGQDNIIVAPDAEFITTLPPATSARRGATFTVRGANGAIDVTYMCVKTAADTYAWAQMAHSLDTVLVSPNGTRFRVGVADDGALTTLAL